MGTKLFLGVTAITFERVFGPVARFDARAAVFFFFIQCVSIIPFGSRLSTPFSDVDNALEIKINDCLGDCAHYVVTILWSIKA